MNSGYARGIITELDLVGATMNEELRLEYWKLGADVTKFLAGTVLLGLLGHYASIALKARESERLEMELFGKYVEHALVENVGTRERFARYFYNVTRTPELKRGWEAYLQDVVQEKAKDEKKREGLEVQLRELSRLASSDKAKAEELKAVRQELLEVRSRLEVRRDAVAPGATLTSHGSGQSSGTGSLSVSSEASK